MRKYSDYKTPQGNSKRHHADELTPEEFETIKWPKYKIIVPTEDDKQEVQDALEHFHDNGYDSDILCANQLAHEYLTPEREPGSKPNIIVNETLYANLERGKNKIILTEEQLNKLTEIYKDNRALVAQICDEVLDRSGELLGIVRDISRNQYHHKCIECGSIFTNDIVYKTQRERVCNNCKSKKHE